MFNEIKFASSVFEHCFWLLLRAQRVSILLPTTSRLHPRFNVLLNLHKCHVSTEAAVYDNRHTNHTNNEQIRYVNIFLTHV